MRKILSSVLAIFILLTNCKIVFAADDTTPPTIVDMKWSATELNVGEVLEVEIEAYDNESGIMTGSYDTSIYIENKKTNIWRAEKLRYDENINKYTAKFEITSDMQSGEWGIRFINITDNVGNKCTYRDRDFDKEYIVNIINGNDDITAPTLLDMKWSATELKVGDMLEVEIEAYDNESGIKTGSYDTSIYIENKKTNIWRAEKLIYDENINKYTAKFEITSDMQNGEWGIRFINITDNVGNKSTYRECDFDKKYILNIINDEDDKTSPTLVDMKWSASKLKIGDILEVEIEAYDNESGISTGGYDTSIYIKNKKTNIWKAEKLIYDENINKYIAKFKITPDMQSGEWGIHFINITDNVGNKSTYREHDLDKEYNFNLISTFNGTENRSVKKGERFNPLDGVSAINNLDGDFTDRITYTGNIYTNKEGIYLIKYHAIGDSGYIYNDYRWITVVNNVITDENGNEEVYFNNDVVLNLNGEISSSNMSITKDGQEYVISESGTITEEGVYKVLLNETTQNEQIYLTDELNNERKEQEEYLGDMYNTKSNANEGNYDLEFIIDKTAPEISKIRTNIAIEDEAVDASEFILANDKYNNVFYSYVNEPNWTRIGKQNINIQVSDAAGNTTNKELEITIYDKCDINNSGKVDILDLAETSLNYNKSKDNSNWNKRLDFNKDGIIDIFDLVLISKKI